MTDASEKSETALTTTSADETNNGIFIGFDRDAPVGTPLTFATNTMLRHMVAIGSSGSGKTLA